MENLKDIFPLIMDRLSLIGEIEAIGISQNHKSETEYFSYKISGKRKVSDFKTLEILKDIQDTFLKSYPLIEKMNMDDELLEVILKKDSEICIQTCESCGNDFDIETMRTDAADNYFCAECWAELAPQMKADYDELVAKGEIDPEE